jgi:NAD-dependent deacetylase
MMTRGDGDAIRASARALREARSVLFVTGAGISADSGLPTYRGIGGLYEGAETDEGVPIEVALSGATMRSRPELCWKYIGQVEAACRGARPNAAHRILAEIERSKERCWVLTQNVDGLHRAAGSRNLIEIHGDIHALRCTVCGDRRHVPDYAELHLPPKCESCGGLVRPDVVLFGEMLPGRQVRTLTDQLLRGFDLVFSIGTTSVFPYIAEPVWSTRARGGVTVEINPGRSEVSDGVDHRIAMGASDAMQAIASVE